MRKRGVRVGSDGYDYAMMESEEPNSLALPIFQISSWVSLSLQCVRVVTSTVIERRTLVSCFEYLVSFCLLGSFVTNC